MKKFSILLCITFLASCSPTLSPTGDQSFMPSSTPVISQTNTVSITNTPGDSPNSIPKKTPTSSEDMPAVYNLPEWMKDAESTIGMTISDINGDAFKIAFLNFEIKDTFEISASSNFVMGYFWIPDGTHFGFLSSDMQKIFLVNLESGKVEQSPTPANAIRFLKREERDKFIEPLVVHGSYPNDFTFLPLYHQDYSYDLHYIANYDFQNTDTLPVIVEDTETGQVTHVTNSSDGLRNLRYMWSPVQSQLAILRGALEGSGMWIPPGETIEIYTPDGNKIASFEGSFADPAWSPDGSKILYKEEPGNSPCILDISSATKRCLREIIRQHPNAITIDELHWSSDGKQIYYIYISPDESGLCVYNLISGDDFCPTNGVQELENFSIVRYTVSPDERFLIFHFGGSCASCDYWDDPTVGVINHDGKNFHILGKEPLVSISVGDSSVMFSYPMITLLWHPNPATMP